MENKEIQAIKDDIAKVSKIAYDFQEYKKNKIIRSYKILCVILALLLIISNLLWFLYENSMETVIETTGTITTFEDIEQNADNGGSNNIIGGDYIGNTEN